VLYHHERFDGTGYPSGIAGAAISLPARILAVADVFESMVTDRPYRRAMSLDDTCRMIADEAGRHFDPVIVRSFLALVEDIRASIDPAVADPCAAVITRLTEPS